MSITVIAGVLLAQSPTPEAEPVGAVVLRDEFAACMVPTYERESVWVPAGESFQCGSRFVPRAKIEDLRAWLLASRQDSSDVVSDLGITPELVFQHRFDVLELLEEVWEVEHPDHPLGDPENLEAVVSFDVVSQAIRDKIRTAPLEWSTTVREIHLTLPGEPTIRVTSRGTNGWLLPWEVEAGGCTWLTSRLEIPRAILPLLEEDSPNRYELDGSEYWREYLWTDLFFWIEASDRFEATLAARHPEKIRGTADITAWFHLDDSRASSCRNAPAVVLDLSARYASPIQRVRWWDPLEKAVPGSWDDLRTAWDSAVDRVRTADWLESWRQAGPDRSIRLLAVGRQTKNLDDVSPSVLLAWKDARFEGEPAIELELLRGEHPAATVFLSGTNPEALIVSAIPGSGDHWLDRLDISFHPRTPSYVRVDSCGDPEVRSMVPQTGPRECKFRGRR